MTEERVALVTGASRGIGAEVARHLAAEGFAVVLAARSEDELDSVATKITATHDTPTYPVPTDVSDHDAVSALVAATLDRFGRLDAAVINAGVGERRNVPLTELSVEEYQAVRGTNVDGAFYTTRAVLDPLRETDGTLVFVGSYKGKYPSTSTPVYAASKWWLRGFAQSVAGRVGSDGVAVSLVNPTGVTTSFGRDTRGQPNSDLLDAEEALTATDVAEAIVTAIGQDSPGAITELDLFRRDIYERF